MSSSSSLHRNSPRIVPVLFLIAMDEQTVSLILPYQRKQTGCPRIALSSVSPQPAFGMVVLYIFGEGRIFSPRDGCMCFGGVRKQIMNSGVLVYTKTGCRKVKIITSGLDSLGSDRCWWSSKERPSSVPSRFLCPFISVPGIFDSVLFFIPPFLPYSVKDTCISYRHFVWMSLTGFHMFIALQLSAVIFLFYTLILWDPYSNLAEVRNGKHYCYYTKEETEDQQAHSSVNNLRSHS